MFSVDLELAKNAHVCWSRIRNDPAAAARMAAKQAVNLQRGVDFAALGAGAGMLVDTLQAVLELS